MWSPIVKPLFGHVGVAANSSARSGSLHDLILVARQQSETFAVRQHPFGGRQHARFLHADRPTDVGRAGFAAEHVRDQLVTEADADEFVLRLVELPDELRPAGESTADRRKRFRDCR